MQTMAGRRDSAGTRVALLMRALRADLQRDWTVAGMATLLGVSDAQLRRLCARAVGATPRQLLCNMRLQAAAVLLLDPSIRVKEIQARVGIADASHFCRDFRDRFGVSPTEYRYQQGRRTDSADSVV
jgi:AraC family transcriptional activator FtrA